EDRSVGIRRTGAVEGNAAALVHDPVAARIGKRRMIQGEIQRARCGLTESVRRAHRKVMRPGKDAARGEGVLSADERTADVLERAAIDLNLQLADAELLAGG